MHAIAKVRAALAEYFRVHAEWRDWKAEQSPGDARNARCAAALRELAAFVERLSVEHQGPLARLAKCETAFVNGEVFAPPHGHGWNSPSACDREASQFGLDAAGDPAAWFEAWSQQVCQEARRERVTVRAQVEILTGNSRLGEGRTIRSAFTLCSDKAH